MSGDPCSFEKDCGEELKNSSNLKNKTKGNPTKFQDMFVTAQGERRASVKLVGLDTLWFNTGTLCNLECKNCYIESSPKNDRLTFLTVEDVEPYLIEISKSDSPTRLIGLTGGEPFLNPNIIAIINRVLGAGFEVLLLTNAYRVIQRHREALLDTLQRYGDKMQIRVSLDHYTAEVHERERGKGAFDRTLSQLKWLYDHGFNVSVASRSLSEESVEESLEGHKMLLEAHEIHLDMDEKIVIFPEMQSGRDVPEITTRCWDILETKPESQMCASERMIVKRKGDSKPVVMPCTLIAYDENFILGETLEEAKKEVFLNHPFCAEFCVLGGASCSSTK